MPSEARREGGGHTQAGSGVGGTRDQEGILSPRPAPVSKTSRCPYLRRPGATHLLPGEQAGPARQGVPRPIPPGPAPRVCRGRGQRMWVSMRLWSGGQALLPSGCHATSGWHCTRTANSLWVNPDQAAQSGRQEPSMPPPLDRVPSALKVSGPPAPGGLGCQLTNQSLPAPPSAAPFPGSCRPIILASFTPSTLKPSSPRTLPLSTPPERPPLLGHTKPRHGFRSFPHWPRLEDRHHWVPDTQGSPSAPRCPHEASEQPGRPVTFMSWLLGAGTGGP